MGKLCQLLEISRSGYYAWLRGGESARKTANQALLRELVRLHEKYPALGLDSLYHMLKPAFHCSRGRVHRLMKAAGIRCVIAKSFSRQFYRGGINMGILPVVCQAEIHDGDRVTVDLENHCIRINDLDPVEFAPFPEQVLGYISEGGLLNYYRKHHTLE